MTVDGYDPIYKESDFYYFNVLSTPICVNNPAHDCYSGFWDLNLSKMTAIKKVGN